MPKKQKSGLYRGKVIVGHDENGKPIPKYVSGRTKRELEQAKQAAREYYISGAGPRKDQLFGIYAREWYRVRKEPFIAASSRASYRSMINLHILPAFGDRNLRAISASELQAFVSGFEGRSNSQAAQAISALRGIFGAAVEDQILERSPAAALKKPSVRPAAKKRALTPEERAKMVTVFRSHPHGFYLAVLYYTGVRPGEARGLQWGDFDFDAGLLHVQRDIDYADKAQPGALKNEASDRYVPIAEDLQLHVELRAGSADDFLFTGERSGHALSQATAERWWVELMLACDLAEPIPEAESKYGKSDIRGRYRPLILPHAMRHNFITMCWENGIDILETMKMVGHSDYRTTRNIYTELDRRHLAATKQKLDMMFAGKKVAQKLHMPIGKTMKGKRKSLETQ